MAAMKQRRISFPRSAAVQNSSVANKDHFIVYTTDEKRFTFPLEYLCRSVFMELLRMSKEEFRLLSSGPIALPRNSTFLNYIISLVKGFMSEDLEKSLITSLLICHFSSASSVALEESRQQTLIYYY